MVVCWELGYILFLRKNCPSNFIYQNLLKMFFINGRDILFFLQKFKTYIYLQFVTDGFDE